MSVHKPLVSIGIPVFNGMSNDCKYGVNFEKSLKSILKQSYRNLQIVISDNCSTDETPNIIKKYLKKDKRIHFYRQKKKILPTENFRFVFKKSTGEYFKFNSHDDYITRNFVEKNLKFLIKNKDYSFSSSPFYFYGANNKKKKIIKIKHLNGDMYNRIKNFFKIAIYSQSCFCALIRKDSMKNNVFGDNKYLIHLTKFTLCEDWLNTIQLLVNGKFKNIRDGKLAIGMYGVSNRQDFLYNYISNSSNNIFGMMLRYIFPIIDFNIAFFIMISKLKNISTLKKIYLNFLSISYNFFFFKIVVKKILLKSYYRNKIN